jgi:antitoxin component YwqK of YwqJK toxin-antitoxin module
MSAEKTSHPNGTLRSEQPVVNSRPDGLGRSWYANGQLQSETPFCDGIMHGVCKFWAADGQPLGSFEMVHGTGTFRTWYEDGRLRTEVSSVRGLPTGRARQWDEAGKLTEAFMYKGRKISKKRYIAMAAVDGTLPKYDDETTPIRTHRR